MPLPLAGQDNLALKHQATQISPLQGELPAPSLGDPGGSGRINAAPPHRFDFRQPFARASASVQNHLSPAAGPMTVTA